MFTKKQFEQLVAIKDSSLPCVSIYIPTYRSGNNQEDILRFKNALSEATDKLIENTLFPNEEMNKREAQRYLSPAYELLEDSDFWLNLSDGLAVFIHKGILTYYKVNVDFDLFVYVNDHFYLQQMMALTGDENRFFILALSQNEVQFFEANAYSITPVIINDLVPEDTAEVVMEQNKETHLQMHSSGDNGGIYHGQGGGKDNDEELLKKYFRQVDEGLLNMLHDENAPLIIYSVDHQVALYKEISNYSNLVDSHISGNPENDDPALIHEKAWSKVSSIFTFDKEAAKNRFYDELNSEKASSDFQEIYRAALNGRVKELFVNKAAGPVWGKYDIKTGDVYLTENKLPDSICLLNSMVVLAHENGAKINTIAVSEMPVSTSKVNAILRF